MVRLSQILVSISTVLTILSSISAISFYASVIKNDPIECNPNAPTTNLLFGIFLICLSLVGLIGAIRGNRGLLLIYAGMMFVLFVCVLLSSAFFMVVSKVSDPKAVKDHREYQLNEYPGWLQRHIVEGEKWVPIKRCMVKDQMCKGLLFEKDTSGTSNERILKSSLLVPSLLPSFLLFEKYTSGASNERIGNSSFLYSCCQPPLQCGFVHTNGTYWEVPKSRNLSEDPDCQAWRNNLDQVCYDCNSCKAGYIRTLKDKWAINALRLAFSSGLIFIDFCIAFWAFRQAPREDHYHHKVNNVFAA